MDLIFYNLHWMSWNIALALFCVSLGLISLKIRPKVLHLISTLIFLLFIPNTIYIVTDLAHLIQRWNQVEGGVKLLLIFQYLIFVPIGFATFIYSMRLLEKNIVRMDKKLKNEWILVAMNFVVAFGVVIGRVQRTNSWEVITAPLRVTENILTTLTSVQLILYILALGFFCNLLYFTTRRRLEQ